MDLDDQLRRNRGSDDLAAVPATALAPGLERMRVDLGLEKDRSRRLACLVLMHTLGTAPDLDVVFKDSADREAAWNWMKLSERLARDRGAPALTRRIPVSSSA